MKRLHHYLEHPLTRGLDLDAPETTQLRRQIIQSKPFLRSIYLEWYQLLISSLRDLEKPVLELGSGAGFLKELKPDVITSDIIDIPTVELVCDARNLPLSNRSLGGIVMTNVLHHISSPRQFFSEASRCIADRGIIAMIEPWRTDWSEFIYTRLHYEACDTSSPFWESQSGMPLSNANNALAWIIFQRDLAQFRKEFPQWEIRSIQPMMPFVYLLSGGVALRSLVPSWSYSTFRTIEKGFHPFMNRLAMFASILLVKNTRYE